MSDSARIRFEHPWPQRIGGAWLAGAGHALLAVTLIGIGITGLVTGRFASIWQSVPHGVPARGALAYLCDGVSLACGAGLLCRRCAAVASRVLFAYLLLWLVLIKGYYIASSPTVEVNYQSAGETAVLVAAAWVLYAWLADRGDGRRPQFAAGELGVRLARGLYALALVAFGLSHFAYLGLTAPLVPAWLPGHVFWAYFTGGAYLAAAIAILTGVLARLATTLSAWQMGLFTLLVWAPLAVTGRLSAGQWSELGVSWALTAAAWVVAESFRETPWLAPARANRPRASRA
jgi:uncharacterized membrane protein